MSLRWHFGETEKPTSGNPPRWDTCRGKEQLSLFPHKHRHHLITAPFWFHTCYHPFPRREALPLSMYYSPTPHLNSICITNPNPRNFPLPTQLLLTRNAHKFNSHSFYFCLELDHALSKILFFLIFIFPWNPAMSLWPRWFGIEILYCIPFSVFFFC